MVAEALTLTGSIHDYPVVPECDLNVNLSKLLETGSLSDVKLAVGDKEFKAHKAILSGVYQMMCAYNYAYGLCHVTCHVRLCHVMRSGVYHVGLCHVTWPYYQVCIM